MKTDASDTIGNKESRIGDTKDKPFRGAKGTQDKMPAKSGISFPWEMFAKEKSLRRRIEDKFKTDEQRRQEGLAEMSLHPSKEM